MSRKARIMMTLTALVGINAVEIAKTREVRNNMMHDTTMRDRFDTEWYSNRYNH